MTGWTYLLSLNEFCSFQSRERMGKASRGELKRWLMNGAVVMNGEPLAWDEEIDFPVYSLVLFPRGNRVTLI